MSRVDNPGPLRSLVSGRTFVDRPGPNIPMITGYALLAGAVAPDVVEQSIDLVGAYMKSLSFGPKPDLPFLYGPKLAAFIASSSGAALHATWALRAARRQVIAPPVVQAEPKAE